MKRQHVYLAGSIEGVSEHEMTAWRNYVTQQLDMADINTLDPTRRGILHERFDDSNIRNRIVQQDLEDISRSKVVFADLRDSTPGKKWGTVMEVSLAQRDRRIIIALVDEYQFKHPFIWSMATEVHTDIDDAIAATISYYE